MSFVYSWVQNEVYGGYAIPPDAAEWVVGEEWTAGALALQDFPEGGLIG